MTASNEELELKDRLSLIESMIAEGRRTTESWGWTFVLWGVAYYIALGWDILGHNPWAWVITMTIFWLLMMAILWYKSKQQTEKNPSTQAGRSISAIWTAMGISMMMLFPAMGFSARFTPQIFVAVACAMLGTTNAASGMILKWKAQICLRDGLVGGERGSLFYQRCAMHDCVFGGHLPLPDRLRHLR